MPDARPLRGLRILITRPREQAGEFAALLEALGAEPVLAPVIRIAPPEDWGPLDAAIGRLKVYDWVIFTSANGVRFFAERLAGSGGGDRAFGRGCRIVAIGPGTARALEEALGVRADAMPERYVAEGVLEALAGEEVAGRRVLIPRAAEAREILPETLRERGASVEVVTAYRTLQTELAEAGSLREDLAEGRIDMVTFTSSSTVRGFVEAVGAEALRELMAPVAVASIGPVASGTARRFGLEPQVEAEVSTVEGLVQAIADFYRPGPAGRRPGRSIR